MVDQSMNAGKRCNFKVNLFASVVAVTPPRITKRGDWMITATLIDESCLKPMTINIFCTKQDYLPKLVWMGDVIRIHRASLEVLSALYFVQILFLMLFIVMLTFFNLMPRNYIGKEMGRQNTAARIKTNTICCDPQKRTELAGYSHGSKEFYIQLIR